MELPDTLLHHVGHLGQIVRLDHFTAENGAEAHSRVIRVANGGGIELDLHPDRALGLGRVTFDGTPMAWSSPTGMVSGSRTVNHGHEWLTSFGGGLLTTCGLDTVGEPGRSTDGQHLPLHGRFGSLSSAIVRSEATLKEVLVEAETRQARVFGENLLLRRRVHSVVGSRKLSILDRVTNEGHAPASHLILYHVNFGWPLISPTTRIHSSATRSVEPVTEGAKAESVPWWRFASPTPGAPSLVYTHELVPEVDASVAVLNTELDVGVRLSYSTKQLPYMHQWKVMGRGTYVLGIEPSTARSTLGREAAASQPVPTLAPGESRTYQLTFEFLRDVSNCVAI